MTKNVCPGGGLYVVEGEVSLLMTAMRRGVRWSSHSHQDEDQDVLMKSLSTLKEALSDAKTLSQLEPGVILAPFLEIIRSEETTGPVTSLALAAVYKMICYGLIDHEHPTIGSCVEAVADAVTHARFVGTDTSSDGVVLMRVLQVLRALVLSQPGDNLSDESICEIMLSCFRICFETRLSELLRRTAENCLRDMVQYLFLRLPQFVDDTRVLPNMKKMRTNGIDNTTRTKNRKIKNQTTKIKTKQSNDDNDEREEARELLSPVDRVKKNHLATTPITPAGNIVDMQGSLDQGTPEKPDIDTTNKNDENDFDKNSTTIEDPTMSKTVNENSVNLEQVCNDENNVNQLDNQSTQLLAEGEKSPDLIQSPIGSVEDLSIDENTNNDSNKNLPKITIDNENIEEYINQQGVRFTPLQQLTPYGSVCIRELFRFLVSLCCPLDKQNTEIMTHLGLNLLQVALEISADAISNFPSLLMLVKDELSRNIILLLNTERLSILASNFQVSYLLFESQREHLKFQMEQFIIKLMEIIDSESRITYEQRELSLEAITRLWRIPGLPAELYLNYDCGLYSTNLYDELIKLLSKTSSALMGTMYSLQFISLDAIILLINGIEARCKGLHKLCKQSRHSTSSILPSRDELINIKTKKRLLALGTEKFNDNPREGITKLAKDGLFGDTDELDPKKIAILLKENPMFDKKSIGEYISRRENTVILDCFVQNFDLRNMRVDQALRPFLEAFRLPGESPLISLVMEKFAAHWYDSNGAPFASKDDAFLLAYGIIMLNVDQHNNNVKRALNPMTFEQFKRNLDGGNGGQNFDEFMLEDIYNAIKNEEIVMPAEHTGLLKENYLWKVLLKRGTSNESIYLKVGNNGEAIDKDIAEISWAPIISALCHAYDKSPDRNLQRRIAQTFLSCATICAHYNMNSDLDTLIVALCKFTGLANALGEPDTIVLHYGGSGRCQLATRTLFKITHQHGNCMRSSWKNIIDCLQTLYKSRLLPKCLTDGDDFIDQTGKISLIREATIQKQPPQEQSILSSLYSYIALDSTRVPHANEATIKKRAIDSIENCSIKQIINESKFLEISSLRSLINALVSVNLQDEDLSVFILELLIQVTIENRDRVNTIWTIVLTHIDNLLTISIRENQQYLLERVAVGMLRLAIRLLRSEEFSKIILPPLIPLTYIPSATHTPLSRQISYGLFELIKTGAANIHTTEDWRVIFNLLECSGAGAVTPKINTNSVLEEGSTRTYVLDQRPISPIPEWVLVSPTGTEAPLPVTADTIVLDRDLLSHDPAALVKCCESLNFLVRDVAHITPFNFELCVRCIRTFVEAALQVPGKRNKITQAAMETTGYQDIPLQLLYLMHALHSGTEKIFKWWAQENGTTEGLSLWPHAWRPLLQGMARLCCDSRRSVRAAAITCLQGELLAHDLTQLTPIEWSQCLEQVIFPLLAQLLGPISIIDPVGVEETRIRAAQLLSKVFLYHLPPLLTLPGFLPLWLTVLDLLKSYMHADNSELLYEAIPESLKNMLLVMASGEAKLTPSSYLWEPTWRTINSFLPNLKNELSIIDQPTKEEEEIQQQKQQQQQQQLQQQQQQQQQQLQQQLQQQQQQLQQQQQQQQKSPSSDSLSLINLVEQEQPTFSGSSIAPQPDIISDISSDNDYKISNKNNSHMTNEDTMDTTMFNSAAYFSEDPAADRLFIVTNP
ncbi:hypothetical protein HCN44_006941 [Aphidius gifuensis]|uniref:SEC7 domain-containing protein n=1 Tax=Aphidius gifuensis TaxID=684658 RepID=A0A835CTC5_APHGI|nr:Golgi-specific brefeldin A-resistance guanine nucleotide exchange factor 1 [Aphidius gifuensis]KAF7995834.1 hypothetical protein HCN44_006941 [Aphidius gifuensis]